MRRRPQHRDLKLDNILVDEREGGTDVKLVDFGLSAHFEDFKLEHDIVGTWVSGGFETPEDRAVTWGLPGVARSDARSPPSFLGLCIARQLVIT